MAATTGPLDHVVIVCGHAIWAGGPSNGEDESEWVIEDWKKGESPTYTAHIRAGLQVLSEDDRAVLVFSGCPTSPATHLSEARSYANLAAANFYWGLLPPPSPSRILVEERALDSYQNILHSLTTFWRTTTHWPARLTIVSHAFKRQRLVHAHAIGALGFPSDCVAFVGIDPPGIGPEVLASEARAVEAWTRDPQGCGEELKGKRVKRNRWAVSEKIFFDEVERARSGIATVIGEDGGEFLVDGGFRPWVRDEEK